MRRVVAFHVRAAENEGYLAFVVVRLNFHDRVSPLGKFIEQRPQPAMHVSVSSLTSLGRNRCYEWVQTRNMNSKPTRINS